MKKILIPFSLILFAACNNSSDTKTEPATTTTQETPKAESSTASTDLSSNPVYQKGLELYAKNDCGTCHKVDEKLTGPAYKDVADKYASAPDTIVTHLAKKIIAGGSGVWGAVPMTPHPNLSEADAEALVKYVLLLKTK